MQEIQEIQVRSLRWEDPPEEVMATDSSTLAWRITWTEEPGGLQSASAAAKSLQSCPTLCNPRDGSPPGSPVLGFSRQEHWSGLPFPSPMHESESEVTQSRPTPSDPMDCSLPGSSVHGIFQARGLEWGAIALWDRKESNVIE